MSINNPRALIRYALVGLALTVALCWALYLVRSALLVIYISLLLATGLSPIVSLVEQRRSRYHLPRWAAILSIYVVFLSAFIGVVMLVLPPLVMQARELSASLPDLLQRGQQWLIDRDLLQRAVTVQEAVKQSPVGGTDIVSTIIGAVWGVVGGIFGAVTILILAFYFLLDSEPLVNGFIRLFPREHRGRALDASVRVTGKVSAWLGGQLLLAAIIGTTAAIGLGLFGVPYFYVLALIAGIGELIPVVGPLLSAIPAVAVALTVSPAMGIGVAIFFFVQQQLENHLLVPRIMSRQVGVSAVVVIVALMIGGSLLGLVGALLAVPTAAILQVLFEELLLDDPAGQVEPADS